MLSTRKTMAYKHVPGHRASRTAVRILLLLLVLVFVACYPQPVRVASQRTSMENAKASGTQVYFYPQKGQTAEQQSRDHFECYNWAIKQTGYDPSLASRAPEQQIKVIPMPPPGHDTISLAVVGAVLGALIAGPRHAGGGALIGAAGGAIAGAASDISRQEYARQMEEAYYKRDRSTNTPIESKALDFRRAMGACLEGRDYSVQ